jgi:hypothetical protein
MSFRVSIAQQPLVWQDAAAKVPCGVTDILQVIVFAAGAHATLRRHRASVRSLVFAEENVLELHHACVREQQGRVVARHKRRTRHDFVPSLVEKIQERPAQFVARHGIHRFRGFAAWARFCFPFCCDCSRKSG